MKDNAWTDSYTGTIPSTGDNTWGWGKVDAHEGLLDLLNTMSIDEIGKVAIATIYPNPTNGKLNIQFSDNQSNIRLKLYDISGKLVTQHKLNYVTSNSVETLNIDNVVNGTYILRIQTNECQETQRVVVSK